MNKFKIIIIMGFLSSLFGCSGNQKEEKTDERTPLETLEYAISDVGLWTWWATDTAKYVQLEFDRTMLLLSDPTNEDPPSNKLAIQFKQPISATIFKKSSSELPENWLSLFNEDKLGPFQIDYEYFSFKPNEIQHFFSNSEESKLILGENYSNIKDFREKQQLGFWAGEVGVVVVSDSMKIVSHSGEIELDEIPELHKKWWGYWRKYWDVIDSSSPLPYDPLCEITIPTTRRNIEKINENLNKK